MSEEKIINFLKDNKFDDAKNLISILLKTEKHNLKYKFYYGLILANEKKFKLEQLRALDNQIPINIILTKRKPIGVDTLHDYHKVKKLMENKKN